MKKKIPKKELKIKLNKEQEKALIYLYKEGWDLLELERFFGIDESLIFPHIKKRKFKISTFDKIYKKQEERKEKYNRVETLKQEKVVTRELLFPLTSNRFSYRYYTYWHKKFLKKEKIKAKCKHRILTVKCALCDKIVGSEKTYVKR